MSKLPPALLERLKRRGIIKDEKESDHSSTKKAKEDDHQSSFIDAPGCPHKTSLTHFCNEFCVKKFGKGVEKPTPEVQRVYEKLVKKYPLPEEWVEVWEAGVCRYYFWNIKTDQVCWYPPDHVKAKISQSAFKIKELSRGQVRPDIVGDTRSEETSKKDKKEEEEEKQKKKKKKEEEEEEEESGDEQDTKSSENDDSGDDYLSSSKEEEEEEEEEDNSEQEEERKDEKQEEEDDNSDNESIDSIDEKLESVFN